MPKKQNSSIKKADVSKEDSLKVKRFFKEYAKRSDMSPLGETYFNIMVCTTQASQGKYVSYLTVLQNLRRNL